MTEAVNPLASFFSVVMAELRRRLTPAEYQDLLEECREMKPEQ